MGQCVKISSTAFKYYLMNFTPFANRLYDVQRGIMLNII